MAGAQGDEPDLAVVELGEDGLVVSLESKISRAGLDPVTAFHPGNRRLVPAEVQMHIGSVLLVIWLLIGAIAAGQRGYYSGHIGNCSKAGTIAVTILAGPLNYMGVNPKINCTVPQPSK